MFFDPLGADFTGWINHFKNEIYQNWIMPQAALLGTRGHVDLEFTVERSGSVSALRLLRSSASGPLDEAAQKALHTSRFTVLPHDYGPASITMRVSLYYNDPPR